MNIYLFYYILITCTIWIRLGMMIPDNAKSADYRELAYQCVLTLAWPLILAMAVFTGIGFVIGEVMRIIVGRRV